MGRDGTLLSRQEDRIMLTDKEKTEIQAELQKYEQKRAACVEALKIVQRHRGWVSDENLQHVAQILDMSPAELDSIATFYSMIFRKPVGRHVILICDSVSCWIMGYAESAGSLDGSPGHPPRRNHRGRAVHAAADIMSRCVRSRAEHDGRRRFVPGFERGKDRRDPGQI